MQIYFQKPLYSYLPKMPILVEGTVSSNGLIFRFISVMLFIISQVSVQGKEPRKYCGVKSPGVLNTGTHFVQLEYHTDGYGQSQGWSLSYTTQSEKEKKYIFLYI